MSVEGVNQNQNVNQGQQAQNNQPMNNQGEGMNVQNNGSNGVNNGGMQGQGTQGAGGGEQVGGVGSENVSAAEANGIAAEKILTNNNQAGYTREGSVITDTIGGESYDVGTTQGQQALIDKVATDLKDLQAQRAQSEAPDSALDDKIISTENALKGLEGLFRLKTTVEPFVQGGETEGTGESGGTEGTGGGGGAEGSGGGGGTEGTGKTEGKKNLNESGRTNTSYPAIDFASNLWDLIQMLLALGFELDDEGNLIAPNGEKFDLSDPEQLNDLLGKLQDGDLGVEIGQDAKDLAGDMLGKLENMPEDANYDDMYAFYQGYSAAKESEAGTNQADSIASSDVSTEPEV